jgi:protoheme IX farnesyltransferase
VLAWRIWRSSDERPAKHMFAYSILYLFLLFALLLAERGLGWGA